MENIENVDCLVISTKSDVTRHGKPYVFFVLRSLDKQFRAQCWDAPQIVCDIGVGEVVKVCGHEDEYNGVVSIKVSSIEVIPNADPMQFIEKYPIELMTRYKEDFLKLRETCVKYGKLLDYLLPQQFCESFYYVLPAATQFHHNKLGGLFVHSIEVAKIALSIANFDFCGDTVCNCDLLVTAALLHDVGKCWTYGFENGVPIVKDDEYLYGHSAKGIELIANAEAALQEDYTAVKHLVASHQGKPEWNCVVKPATKEATILHISDYVSSRLCMFDEAEYKDGKVWSNVMKQYIFEGVS